MAIETVMVTGAGGFIGSNLVDHQLALGRKVVAFDVNIDRLDHLKTNGNCKSVAGDLRDLSLLDELLQNVDVVFHLASAHLEVSKAESYFWDVNVQGVTDFLGLAKKNGVKRFVHCSTVGVYGPLKKLPADESTSCDPDILYEQTKLAGENAVTDFIAKNDFSAVIVRPAWVYGQRCPRTLKLFRSIMKKRFLKVGACENYRHPIYISDMLDAFELTATKEGIDGKTYLIAAKQPVRLGDLINQIIEVQKMNYKPINVPFIVMTPVCIVVEMLFKIIKKEPPFSTRSLKFFTESSAFDISKAETELGFDPQVELKDGLLKTYQYYQKEGLI